MGNCSCVSDSCLLIVAGCINQLQLSFRSQMAGMNYCRILEVAQMLLWKLWNKCCVSFIPDSCFPKSSTFRLICPQNIIPYDLGSRRCFFFFFLANMRHAFMLLLVNSVFCLVTLTWIPHAPTAPSESLSNGGIMNTVLISGKWSLQFLRCSSIFFCDFMDEPSMHFWRNFDRLATSEKIHYWSIFSILK